MNFFYLHPHPSPSKKSPPKKKKPKNMQWHSMLYGIKKGFFTNSYYKVTSYWDKDDDELNMSNKSYYFSHESIKTYKTWKHRVIILELYSTCVNHTYFESQMLKYMCRYCYNTSVSRNFYTSMNDQQCLIPSFTSILINTKQSIFFLFWINHKKPSKCKRKKIIEKV